MAEVALPATVATPSIVPAVSGTAIGPAGAPAFANLLTALADPSALTGTPPAPAVILAGVKPMMILPLGPTTIPVAPPEGALSSDAAAPIAEADADADTPAPDMTADSPADATPDLAALLAWIAAPAQVVAMPTRASASVGRETPPASAKATLRSSGVPSASPTQPVADTSIANEPATPPATPERSAQAFAAIRALVGSPSARKPSAAPDDAAPPLPSPATPGIAPVDNATAALDVAQPSAAPMRGDAMPQEPAVAANVVTLASAAAAPPPDPASPAPSPPAVAVAVAEAGGSASMPIPDPSIAPLSAESAPAPRPTDPAVVELRSAAPVKAEARIAATSPTDAQRPTPQRARKDSALPRPTDLRVDQPAPRTVSVETASTAPASRADDPLARQLSIAQDGQWLDALTRDIAGAGNADGQLRFRLDPDRLGSLTVQIAQGSDGASIRLTASTEAARTILADAQPRLVAEARAQGLSLREATVETRSASPAPAPAASAPSGGSFSSNAGGRGDQGGVAAQLQQQSQQQGGGRRHAPDQPRQADTARPSPASKRSSADLYA